MTSEYYGVSEINKKYIDYYTQIFEVYEDFLFVEYYYPEIHKLLKKGGLDQMEFESITSEYSAPFKKNLLYGIIDRTLKKVNPSRSLFDAVSLTENYFQDLTHRIYRDHSYKLAGGDETPEQKEKLIKIIIDSDEKEEMISKIAEEKIRGIFYGKPSDFFTKDKAKIGINKNFETVYNLAIDDYQEIIARRNIYTHNNGKVDRKYLREVKNSTYALGQKPKIDKAYIKKSIHLLQGLASVVTKQSLQANYPMTCMNRNINKYVLRFDKEWKNK